MQDSPCDFNIECTYRKSKISYVCWECFSQISILLNFGMCFEHFRIQFRDEFLFFESFENFKFSKIKIENNWFINATALRAPPAVTRLTVHRRPQIWCLAFWKMRLLEESTITKSKFLLQGTSRPCKNLTFTTPCHSIASIQISDGLCVNKQMETV